MLKFILEIILWLFFIYGFLNFIKDVFENKTYNKISKRIKLVLMVKDVEEGIENYIRELNFGKNFYNNLVIIDMDSNDKTRDIIEELQKDGLNIKILSKSDGKDYFNSELNQGL